MFLFLAAAACPGIEIAEALGVNVPAQDPGFLKVDRLSADIEIRTGATLIPAALGILCLVIGRLGASNAPRESLGRGIADAAAWATVAALLGVIATGVVTVLAALSGNPPRLVPQQDVVRPGVRVQERVERYLTQVLLPVDEVSGQVQRFGLAAVLVFGLVAEFWFLNALGRYAAALHSPVAAGRVTRFLLLLGLLAVLAAFGPLAYDLYAYRAGVDQLKAKWNDLGEKGRVCVVGGGVILVSLVVAVIYFRLLGGVKRGIREAVDGGPAAG